MRISPIFTQQNGLNTTAFRRTTCRKPRMSNSNMGNNNDVFMKMAEASYENSARGAKMQLELQQMGLI